MTLHWAIGLGTIAILGVIALTWWVRRGGSKDKTCYAETIFSGSVSTVVTLVHGTWPRGPLNLSSTIEWYKTDSSICQALLELTWQKTLIHRFQWSGANSVAARLAAATELQEELSTLFDRFPMATHVIVAHSHGAAVALTALKEESILARTSGVVCLSTPFLHTSLRAWAKPKISSARKLLLECALFLPCWLGFLIGFGLVYMRQQLTSDWFLRTGLLCIGLLMAALGATSFLALMATFIFKKSFVQRIWNELYRGAKTYVQTLQYPSLPTDRMLIVRAPADEASTTLAVGQFFAWLTGLTDSLAAKLLLPVAMISPIVGAYFLVTGLAERPFQWNLADLRERLVQWDLSGSALVTLVLVAIGAQFIRILTQLPFGATISWFTPLLDLSVEAAPPGTWTIRQVPVRAVRGLFHSAIHQDPAIAAAVSEWIATKLPQNRPTPSPREIVSPKLC